MQGRFLFDCGWCPSTETTLLALYHFFTVRNPKDMTANLQGPIIINPHKRIGRQAISTNEKYGVKHGILEEMNKRAHSEE